jgi:hypothetical protein
MESSNQCEPGATGSRSTHVCLHVRAAVSFLRPFDKLRSSCTNYTNGFLKTVNVIAESKSGIMIRLIKKIHHKDRNRVKPIQFVTREWTLHSWTNGVSRSGQGAEVTLLNRCVTQHWVARSQYWVAVWHYIEFIRDTILNHSVIQYWVIRWHNVESMRDTILVTRWFNIESLRDTTLSRCVANIESFGDTMLSLCVIQYWSLDDSILSRCVTQHWVAA